VIEIKKGVLERIGNWTDETVYILADFDRTITVGDSESSWSVLSKSDKVPSEYKSERQELYKTYRPIEVDETIDEDVKNALMVEWWNKHINLFVKYQIPESVISTATKDLSVMKFRAGGREFLENMKKRNIPVIIISAGIGNFIEQFFEINKCNFDNIYIVSNFIKFENGVAVGVADNVIHSLNKNEVALTKEIKDKLGTRHNIILMGDSIGDVKMAREEVRKDALKIGFLEENVEESKPYFEKEFDVVCTNNTGLDELSKDLKILKR
jgi:5'-nucleotidase